jgi:hypothetical protein
MPMKSQAQRGYLWAKHPEIAQEFEDATPKGKRLPQHVGKHKGKGLSKAQPRSKGKR